MTQIIKTFEPGSKGLLQITEHSLEARGELLTFETTYASLNSMFTNEKAEEIRQGFLDRKIRIRELTNQMYHEQYTKNTDFHEQLVQIRYINPSKLKIEVETLVYNDVVALYQIKEDGFCIEIHSAELANQQRQLFEFIWKQADLPIIGKNGRTSMF